MEKNKKYNIEFIKSNLNLIILIPTILGGLWQLFELSSISISFIRFFSVSQIIPDGILLLTFISIIFIAYRFSYKMTKSGLDESPSKTLNIIRFIIITIIGGIWIFVFIYRIIKLDKIELFGLIMSIVFLTSILTSFFYLIKTDSISNFIKKPLINEIILTFLSLGVIFIFFILLNHSFDLFHKTYMFPNNWGNESKIESFINEKYDNKPEFDILYFNDKYFFLEIKLENNESIIEVMQFNEIFKNYR